MAGARTRWLKRRAARCSLTLGRSFPAPSGFGSLLPRRPGGLRSGPAVEARPPAPLPDPRPPPPRSPPLLAPGARPCEPPVPRGETSPEPGWTPLPQVCWVCGWGPEGREPAFIGGFPQGTKAPEPPRALLVYGAGVGGGRAAAARR